MDDSPGFSSHLFSFAIGQDDLPNEVRPFVDETRELISQYLAADASQAALPPEADILTLAFRLIRDAAAGDAHNLGALRSRPIPKGLLERPLRANSDTVYAQLLAMARQILATMAQRETGPDAFPEAMLSLLMHAYRSAQ
jgi:hypothetical protein